MFQTKDKVETESYFELGQSDFIAGRGFHQDFDRWNKDSQTEYELGRLSIATIIKINTAATELAVA